MMKLLHSSNGPHTRDSFVEPAFPSISSHHGHERQGRPSVTDLQLGQLLVLKAEGEEDCRLRVRQGGGQLSEEEETGNSWHEV